MRLDIQQTKDIKEKLLKIAEDLKNNNKILKFTVLNSYMFDLITDDSVKRLKVELGDHSIFPVTYTEGRAPETGTEIAVSVLNADDFELTTGSSLTLLVDDVKTEFTVSGIYSDITNGGKTAKAVFQTNRNDILWSVIPVKLSDKSLIDSQVSVYKKDYPYAKVSNIDDYINQIFSATIAAVKKVSLISIITTVIFSILITLLFIKMLVIKDRRAISILKTVGFTDFDIRKQYIVSSLIILLAGTMCGTILANITGGYAGKFLLASFGSITFDLKINLFFAYIFSPLLMLLCVGIATITGTSEIKFIKVFENIKE